MIDRLADKLGANRVVLALALARLVDALGNSILFIIIPLYVVSLPAPWLDLPDPLLIGILISLYGFIAAFTQPVVGALTDRLSRRKPIILAGLAIMAVGTLAFVFAERFGHLLAIRAVQGIGVALTIPASLALMATATEKRTRGGSMGVYTSARMVGFAIGPLFGGWLYVRQGFDAAFYIGAALVAVGLVLVHLWVDERPIDVEHLRGTPFRPLQRGHITPGIVGLAFCTFVMAVAFTEITALENEVNLRLNQTAFGFGVAFSALMVSRLLLQVPLGALSDRIGRKPLVMSGLVLLAPATALLGLVGTTLELTGARVLQGVATAAIAAPAYAMAAELAPAGGEGRQLSFVTMGFGLGIAVGPLLAGGLSIVSFTLPFYVGGLLSLLGAAVVWRIVPETVTVEVRGAADRK